MARHPKRKNEPATALNPDTDRFLDGDADLAARAAWMYFGANLTQAEVADRLNIPVTRAHRLIARASRDGLVRVFIDGPVGECVALEEAISAQFGLGVCHVAPDSRKARCRCARLASPARVSCGAPWRVVITGSLASAMDEPLHRRQTPAAHAGKPCAVRVTHRRPDAAALSEPIRSHPSARRQDRGGVLFPAGAGIRQLDRGPSRAACPARNQRRVRAGAASNTLPGRCVGDTPRKFQHVDRNAAGCRGRRPPSRRRPRGDLCHCFDAKGKPVESDLVDRAVSIPIESLTGRRIVAIAGGAAKVEALRAVLASGVLAGLITDEVTAQELVRKRPAKAGVRLADRRSRA